MSRYPHGYCPTCSKYVALRPDGTFWLHKAPAIDLISEIDPDYCISSFEPGIAMPQVSLEHLLDGADFREVDEAVRLTNEQLWGRLLLMSREEREKFLAIMGQSAREAQVCFLRNHAGLEAEANFWRERAITYQARMRKVLTIAHSWRAAAKMAGREAERLKRLMDLRDV